MFTIAQLIFILGQQPTACAELIGSMSNASVMGMAYFYQTSKGIFLLVQVQGLPTEVQSCGPTFFGFHIHEGASCTGTNADPFANVGGHYNPERCAHPRHTGDLPPLINNNGNALMAILVSSFSMADIIGRTLVVHSGPDDFNTQPTGAAGEKIACGQILPCPMQTP